MSTPLWQPGTLYQPGDLVRPRSATGGAATQPSNPDFETGTFTNWTATAVGGVASGAVSTTFKFTGTKSFLWAGGAGSEQEGGIGCDLVNDFRAPVAPGQTITLSCYCMSVPLHREHGVFGSARLYWYNASSELIAISSVAAFGDGGPGHGFGTTGQWVKSTVTGVAPAGAAFASAGAFLLSNQGDTNGSYVDAFSWDYISPAVSDAIVFRATQPASGFSGSEEPAWPVVIGETVYDNEVIWEGVATSRVVWEASPILVSGSTEPDFPEQIDGSVVDNTIVWHAISRRIEDEKCPHSKIVAIAASKIFAGDDDIVAYSSTVNPLDWSSPNDAGYLPFGLQTYGGDPVAALGLYRSNLVASSSTGYQMWQVDPNPANMAFLDGQPVPFEFHLSLVPVANDLVGLTSLGIRSIGIAGASTNLQAGYFGKGVDPLVKPLIAAAKLAGYNPLGLMWPAAGQYWLFFGATAMVLTVNGSSEKDMSWSRYVFPAVIDDWTILDTRLFLRAGAKVWEVSADAECADDIFCDDSMIAPVLGGAFTETDDIQLEWTPATSTDTEITGYKLYRKVDAGSFSLLQTFDASVLEFLDTDIELLSTYSYKVFGIDEFGRTAESNTVVLAPGFNTLIAVFSTNSLPVGQQVMTSQIGSSYTPQTTPIVASAAYLGCCFSDDLSLFVAVGTNHSLVSSDGVTWTSGTMPGTFESVTWSPTLNIFAACGSGLVATSTDGLVWTLRTAPASGWGRVLWVPFVSKFVMCGNGGTANFAYSADGITWTTATGGNAGDGLAHNGAVIVSVCQGAATACVSVNGTSWSTPVAIPTAPRSVAFGNGTFAALGNNLNFRAIYSGDGIDWSYQLMESECHQVYRDICFSEDLNLFFAVSTDPFTAPPTGRVSVSADGKNWGPAVTPSYTNAIGFGTICAGRVTVGS